MKKSKRNMRYLVDPAWRFAYKYQVSPAVLKVIYRLRFSEILGKKRNRLMPYKDIAIIMKNKFNIDINKRIVRYWILECEQYRKLA